MRRIRGRLGRASLIRSGSHTLAVRTLPDGRLLVHPVPPPRVVAGARLPRERQDRLACQGCGETFPAMEMWIDAADSRLGFCDGCYYTRRRREHAGEGQ